MTVNITGEFDVVAEFAIPAANRVLAAMHRVERFPHSVAVRVDDNPPPGSQFPRPTIVGAVDTFGDPVVNHQQIGKPDPFPGQLAATDPIHSMLDQLVNPDVVGSTVGPIVPSHIQGRAQLQLSPPRIEVDDRTGTNVTVLMDIMSRFFPDPNTAPLAEFIRGELKITAPVSQPAPQAPKVIDVDIKADQAVVNFTPAFTSRPLSAEDLAGINLVIRNALKTSFQPSSIPLPAGVNFMQFRTLFGAQSAVAALLNMGTAAGNLASFTSILTQPNDDFAFAAGVDYAKSVFHPDLSQPYHYWVYQISVSSVTVDLQEGKIVVTASGNAVGDKWWTVNFGFTVHQDFTLQPASMVPGGPLNTLELVPGAIGGGVVGWLVNLFGGNLLAAAGQQPGQNPQDAVHHMFNTDENLGGFFRSLLAPARPNLRPTFASQSPGVSLTYTSAEIHASGIVAHGSLAVSGWPPVHVEFQEIPTTGPINAVFQGPDYSALKSWIPGGTIQRYELRSQGQAQPFITEENKFILSQPPPVNTGGALARIALPGYVPLCLTVRGTRLTSSGPVVLQNVAGTACGYSAFPIVSGLSGATSGPPALLALAQPGPGGQLVVAGHVSTQLAAAGSGSANRLVHFADQKTAGSLEFLTQALLQSKRDDATTAILAVLTPDQLAKARYTEGVIYADDQGGVWERLFRVKTSKRPLTLIVGPTGKELWQKEGEIEVATLAAALAKFLVAGGSVKLGVLRTTLRLGQPSPNFLFEYAPKRELTLRKLAGRPVILVFWKSSSQPSIEAVRDLQDTTGPAGGPAPMVLAINDGDPIDLAKKVAAENRLSATIVTDPKREISFAYGVNIWPTIVTLDALGLVRDIRYGRLAGQQPGPPSAGKAAASR